MTYRQRHEVTRRQRHETDGRKYEKMEIKEWRSRSGGGGEGREKGREKILVTLR